MRAAFFRRDVRGRAREHIADDGDDRGRIVQHEHGVASRHVIEERFELFVERGHVRVRAEERATARHVVDQCARFQRRHVDRIGELRQTIARARHVLPRQNRLAHRRDRDLWHRRRPCLLRVDVERFDRDDEIAIELDANGIERARGPHVEERAAHRERSRILDERNADVPRLREARDEPIAIERVLRDDAMRVRAHDRARNELAHERRRRHHQHTRRVLRGETR